MRPTYSLKQMIAWTTAVAAAGGLYLALAHPPLGLSGVERAPIPAVVLVVALWFCRQQVAARLALYAITAGFICLASGLVYFLGGDWMFGHFKGPPQFLVASYISSLVGVAAGIAWVILSGVQLRKQFASGAAVPAWPWVVLRGAGGLVIGVLTLICAFVAVPTTLELVAQPGRMTKELDDAVVRRFQYSYRSLREVAEGIARCRSRQRGTVASKMTMRAIQPSDDAAIPALLDLLSDHDPGVRSGAATTLKNVMLMAGHYIDSSGKPIPMNPAAKAGLVQALQNPDEAVQRQVAAAILNQPPGEFGDPALRLEAVRALGSASDQPAVDEVVPLLLRALEGPPDERIQTEAIQALGRIAPHLGSSRSGAPNQMALRLASLIEFPYAKPAVRSAAMQTLAAMGPAAKTTLPSLFRAADAHLLTADDAKLIRKIDPVAAERFESRPVHPADPRRGVPPGVNMNNVNALDIEGLVRQLNSDDSAERVLAASVMYSRFSNPNAIQNLSPELVRELVAATMRPEINVGTAALTAIRMLGPTASEPLIEVTKHQPSPPQLQAIYALGNLKPPSPEAVARLSELLDTGADAPSRTAAARALGSLGPAAQTAIPAFEAALKAGKISAIDAKQLYKIDAAAAERLKIPR